MSEVQKWLAVASGLDTLRLIPAKGSGPDFFVKLSSYEQLQRRIDVAAKIFAHFSSDPIPAAIFVRDALTGSEAEFDELLKSHPEFRP